MKKTCRIGEWVRRIYMGIGAAAMGLLAFLVIFTVIMRYCFSLSWKSLSEFNVTLFCFTTFWAMGLNVLMDEHVSINILYDRIPPAIKRWVCVFNNVVMLVVDCLEDRAKLEQLFTAIWDELPPPKPRKGRKQA